MQDSVENLVTLFENGTLNRQQLIQGLLAATAPPGMVAHAQADTSTSSAFRGRSLNHVTLSVTDVDRSQAFYSRLLGGALTYGSVATEQRGKVATATLDFPDGYISFFERGKPRVHHFCVGVEHFAIDAAVEKLRSDFPESTPTVYRGEELYFRDPDGILGQISAMDYRGQRKTP
jgi:catechol 2,3-dioxygenase-like lactoylglutathione lyase family enzyme